MSEETFKSTNDRQNGSLTNVLQQLIDTFLREAKKNRLAEDITDSVYNFFGAIAYEEFLSIYSNVSAFALSALAMNPKARDGLLEVMGEEDFEYFCQMLYSIIELCNKINTSEIMMAELDKARWRRCNPQIEPNLELKKAMLLYECRLKCLKENV